MAVITREVASLDDLSALAAEVAAATVPGDLLVLTGPLGAGKTTFVQQLAAALGSGAAVGSPTYTLVHEYPTPRGLLVHVDLYRLSEPERVAALGIDDYLDRSRLVAVEWGEGLLADHPEAHRLDIALAPGGEGPRTVTWRRPEPGR